MLCWLGSGVVSLVGDIWGKSGRDTAFKRRWRAYIAIIVQSLQAPYLFMASPNPRFPCGVSDVVVILVSVEK